MPPILQHATMTHTCARNSWILTGKSGSVSCGVTDPFPGSWCTRFCLCPPRIYFPVLGKFWQIYGGVNGDLLQEGLCHTQVCCPQSPCPCSSPLLTHPSTGDTQTQFCLSLCGVSGSWSTQGLFEPSEPLWQEWGLILNANLPLLPSCWGFSFALGHGISPRSCSSDAQPPLQRLPLAGYYPEMPQNPHYEVKLMLPLRLVPLLSLWLVMLETQ